LTHFSASRRTPPPPLYTCGGHRQPRRGPTKKEPQSKMSGAGVFSGSCLPMGRCGSFCTARLPAIGHSALPLFLFPAAKQARSRGKILVGLGNGRVTKFLCTRNAAAEKDVPSMGASRGAPASLGPSSQNFGLKSALPGPWWALDTSGWSRVVGGHVSQLALLLQERPWAHGGAHRRLLLRVLMLQNKILVLGQCRHCLRANTGILKVKHW
jgi:hypothetical protein